MPRFDPVAKTASRRAVLKGLAAAPAVAALGLAVPRAAAQDGILVTMVTDTAGLGDQNFNDLAKRGLDQAAAELGVSTNVIESTDQASFFTNLTSAAEGSDLTVAVGFLLIDAVDEVAPQFPDSNFLLIDAAVEQPNVLSVLFKEQEGAFLGGVAAGLTTQTDRIGVVGGEEIPPVIRYEVGFRAGVQSVNPSAQVDVAYVGSFGDPATGREFALAQFNGGADVVFPIAGATGNGANQAAAELGPGYFVIDADTDQGQLSPENQLCVVQKGVDVAVFNGAQQVVNGTFQGGVQNLGLAEGGMDLTSPRNRLAPDVVAAVEQYRALIVSGGLVVPATEEELAAFQPVPLPTGAPGAGTPAASPVASPAASPAATPSV
jgi:basic membrane protein A